VISQTRRTPTTTTSDAGSTRKWASPMRNLRASSSYTSSSVLASARKPISETTDDTARTIAVHARAILALLSERTVALAAERAGIAFFSTMKTELADRFESCGEAQMQLFDYIEVF
jgi:hypothetical protein